jgi:aspartate/methionine/tyrosine aminotransferase
VQPSQDFHGFSKLDIGRDGFPAEPKDIYLSAGASSGVNTLLHIICGGPNTGVLVPIPQYPLYTASLAVLNAKCVPYYLDESKNWGTDLEAIKTAYKKAVEEGTDVRAIVIINPGNPTGASLSEDDIKAVIGFAAQEKLVVMADEVYQTNVFLGKFTSFKSVLRTMQKADAETYKYVELASLHSVSKGMVGECGHRGGYFELCGFDPEVVEQIYKFVSISLCAPVIGQCLVEMMVNPPKEGEPSYELYKQEWDGIFAGLKKRATALYEAFKEMEGVECQDPQVCLFSTFICSLAYSSRVQCTSFQLSNYPPKLSKPPRKTVVHLMSTMLSVCLMRREYVSFPVRVSDRKMGPCISERHSWRRVRSGLGGSRSFIRSLWTSLDRWWSCI